jgi:hypothetical protein
MPVRASAFGPTRGAGVVRRPSTLDRLESGPAADAPDSPVSHLATPSRQEGPPTAPGPIPSVRPGGFSPLFPEAPSPEGAEPAPEPSEGFDFGRLTPEVLSVPLLSYSQEQRQGLLDRVAQSRARLGEMQEPGEVSEGFGTAREAVGGAGKALQGAKALESILREAGFEKGSIDYIVDAFGPGGEHAAGAGASLAEGGAEAAGEEAGAAGLAETLGPYAAAVPYIMAALRIAQTLSSENMQGDQKAIQIGGTLAALAAAVVLPVAIAAPVAMGIAYVADHFIEQAQDIPHDVREQLNVADRSQNVDRFARELDEATTPRHFFEILQDWSTPREVGRGGEGDRMAFESRWGGGTVFDPKRGDMTLKRLMSDPGQFSILSQLGVSDTYKEPWNVALTNMVRNRLALFARLKAGDPQARIAMKLLLARVTANRRQREMALAKRKASDAAVIGPYEREITQGIGGDGDSGTGDSSGTW